MTKKDKYFIEYQLNFIRCKFHSSRVAKHKLMSSENETLYICTTCYNEIKKEYKIVSPREKHVDLTIQIQNKKYNLDDKKLFSSSSVIKINKIFSYQRWKDFGKEKYYSPYTKEHGDLVRESLEMFFMLAWEHGEKSVYHYIGDKLILSKYDDSNYLFSMDGRPLALIDDNFKVLSYYPQ